jgi:hypothetical protein
MTATRSWSRAALASLVLGLASLLFLGVTGIPALYLGWRGLRAVNESDGELQGWWPAVGGLVLGGLGTLVTVLGFLAVVFVQLQVRSQRVECTNNLRLIGQGLTRYQQQHGAFPPAGLPVPGLEPEQRLSWMAGIVPFLIEGKPESKQARFFEELGRQLDPTKAWDDPGNARIGRTPVRVFQCPAHAPLPPGNSPGFTSYVGLAGIGADALSLPRSSERAGMFGFDRGVKPEDFVSGMSLTLAASERADLDRKWIAAGLDTCLGLDPRETRYLGPGRPLGGLHPEGAFALYADTRVAWLGDAIDPATLRSQATLSGREAADP